MSGVLAFIVALGVVPSATLAGEPGELSANLGLGAFFAPERWVPVRLRLRNNSPTNRTGFCRLPISSNGQMLDIEVPASSPAHSLSLIDAYACFPDPTLSPAKRGAAPPLTIAEWRVDGKLEDRCEIVGQPASSSGRDTSNSSEGRVMLTVDSTAPHPLSPAIAYKRSTRQQQAALDAAVDPTALESIANEFTPYHLVSLSVAAADLPRAAFGYDAAPVVMLQSAACREIDPGQQQALIQFVHGGGILVVAAPAIEDISANQWLADLLPVEVIGQRDSDRILPASDFDNGKPIVFRTTVPITEAVAGAEPETNVQVLLRDHDYIYAAVRRVGLGRIVFTGFPAGAIDPKDVRGGTLWRNLLGTDAKRVEWPTSRLAVESSSILQQMIGHPAASWTTAAVFTGIYASLVLILQLTFTGPRRPTAFALSAGVAILGCGAVLAGNTLHQGGQSLSSARIATMDFAPSGAGLRQEAMALVGRDDDSVNLCVGPDAWLRPAGASNVSAVVRLPPFSVPSAGVKESRIDHVWLAAAPMAADMGAFTASGQFRSDGLRIDTNNMLNSPVRSPLLIWNSSNFHVPEISIGNTSIQPGSRNSPGDYTNSNVLSTEQSGLRGTMLQAAMLPPENFVSLAHHDPVRFIAGWLDTPGGLIASSTASSLHEMTLARTALALRPSPPGETVHIDGAFAELVTASQDLPVDVRTGTWPDTAQTESWLIAMTPPKEIGTIKTLHAVVHIDFSAPVHQISLRCGQCVAGRVHANANGALIGEWPAGSAVSRIEFDCEDADRDANGWLWIRLTVVRGEGSTSEGATWRLNHFEVDSDVQVISAPKASPVTWDIEK